jgi:hypothetical protein
LGPPFWEGAACDALCELAAACHCDYPSKAGLDGFASAAPIPALHLSDKGQADVPA